MNSIFHYYAPPSAEDSTSSGLFSIMRQVVYVSRQTAQKRGECTPTTCFTRRSGCTRSRLDTFRVSPYPDGNRCKATPPLIWIHHLPKDPIMRAFFLSSRADGGDKGSAPPMTRFSRQSGCTLLCSALALRRGRTHVLGGSPSGSVADARSRALWVSPCSVFPYGGCLNGEAQPSRSFIQAPALVS